MKFEQKFKIGIREIGLRNKITNYGILSFLEDIATNHSDQFRIWRKRCFLKKKSMAFNGLGTGSF